jgi:hypothetical protein
MFEKIPNIFLIATIEIREIKKDIPLTHHRTVGWFPTFNLAEYAVVNNYGDIYETGYQYAVIEEIAFGLYSCPPVREFWYEFDKEQEMYVPIVKPKIFKNVVNFTIG